MAEKTEKAKKPVGKAKKKALTIEASLGDFKRAYESKRDLIEREKQDFLFAMGEQWTPEEKETLRKAGFKPFVDNRIQANIHLLTGLERQNRTEFKAFPEGEEDGLKAQISSALLKDAIKKSGFSYKKSDQFKDGVTCGESHLELYLDNTESLINGKPCWKKIDGNRLFWDPAAREYDLSDAQFIYKLTLDVAREDLINLYPEKRNLIESAKSGKIDFAAMAPTEDGAHIQRRDYDTKNGVKADDSAAEGTFDLIERFYRKHVERVYVGDKKTGEIKEVENLEKAKAFVEQYKSSIAADQDAYDQVVHQTVTSAAAGLGPEFAALPIGEQVAALEEVGVALELPPPPPEQNPDRFIVIERLVPEIWCFAHVTGIEQPLADERAWFYPRWKGYPFVPYFARFSTAPLSGPDRHLLIQGLVHGVKGAQEIHNKAQMLQLRHLNSSTNSGWITEEGSWVDPKKVEQLGSAPSVNLEYKKGKPKPDRIQPAQLSQGHLILAENSAESIKAQTGINADLIAAGEDASSSGRAIALRTRQGLVMVQEPFDNLARSCKIAGQMTLSQLGEIYDTETAIKVLGEAFMAKNFPAPQLPNPETGELEAIPDPETGKPMAYDKAMAEIAIAEVLQGELETYDVSVGEVVASDSQLMAQSAEIKDLAGSGVPIPPDMLVRYAQIPESAKQEILAYIKQAQAAAVAVPPGAPAKPPTDAAA